MIDLKTLPVCPDMDNETSVLSVFVKERDSIKTLEDLANFVERWQSIWIDNERERIDQEESLISGSFNAQEVLECIQKAGECGHQNCCADHIFIPISLLQASLISKKYGVPFDVALIQMNGGLQSLKN